jgi:hypothetical protein
VSASVPEEQEFERCRAEIGERRRRLAELQSELAALKTSLDRFAALCQSHLGNLMEELKRVTRETIDYERRLERLRAAPDDAFAASDDVESELFDWWAGEATAEKARHRGGAARRRRRLAADDAAEATRLYLDLAKRCHPDLATTPEDRAERERVMQRVNEAFRDRDLAALRAIHRESEAADPAFALRPVAERLAWARGELARLGNNVSDLRSQITLLRASQAYGLWRRHRSGESIFEALEDDLEARIVTERKRLDGLIDAHRQLIDDRRDAPVATA